MDVAFTLNEQEVPLDQFLRLDYESGGQQCMAYILAVEDWAGGEHHAVTTLTFTAPLNDGVYDFPAGVQTFYYNIYVKP